MKQAAIIAKATRRPLALVRQRAEARFARRVLDSLALIRDTASTARIAQAIPQGADAVIEALNIDALLTPRLTREYGRIFADTYETAGDTAARRLKAQLVGKDIKFSVRVEQFGFSVINPRGLRILAERGARAIKYVVEATKDAVRAVMTEGTLAGLPVLGQANRIKALVGLLPQHAVAVERLRADLIEQGVNAVTVARRVATKERELRLLRARNIARTEAANVATAAQIETWEQAAEDGLYDKAVATRVWITSSEPCPKICEPMADQVRAMDEPFLTGDGRLVDGPGYDTHVNCLCDVAIRPEG